MRAARVRRLPFGRVDRAGICYNAGMNKIFLLGCAAAVLCGCRSSVGLAGADRDEHGCIASAGYTWSRVAGDCLRLWEAGVQLTDAQDPAASLAAYAVISGDGTKTEVFLPKAERSLVLTRSFAPDGPVWTGSSYRLERKPEGWRLFNAERLIFQAGNPPDSSR